MEKILVFFLLLGIVEISNSQNLLHPPSDTSISENPVFEWTAFPGNGYFIGISTTSNMSGLVIIGGSVYTSWSMSQAQWNNLNYNQAYYWSVQVYNETSSISWVPSRRFWKVHNIGINLITNIIPSKFQLNQNYPNPFNPVTNIKFDIPKSSATKLIVYDALGREVATLVNEKLRAGSFQVDWDGSSYTSGVYIYRLEADEFVEVKKMVMVK